MLKPVSISREVVHNMGEGSEQRDESTLARLGKRPVLKVSTHLRLKAQRVINALYAVLFCSISFERQSDSSSSGILASCQFWDSVARSSSRGKAP